MTSPTGIDPEIRELLQELASDQGARLLRVTPQEVHASLYETDRRVFPSAPFLRNAEKKLLEAYRNELGRLLYRWGVVLLFQRGTPDTCHYGDWLSTLPHRKHVSAGMAHMREQVFAAQLDEDTSALLLRCTATGDEANPWQVFAASLRLRPSHRTVRTLGSALLFDGSNPSQGRQLLQQALEEQPVGTDASYSLEAVGWAACKNGDWRTANTAYEAAVTQDPDRLPPIQAWFATALQAGDEAQVLRSSEHLDSSRLHGGSLEWYPQSLRLARGSHSWQPTKESLLLGRKYHKSLGARARRIIDAFTH